MPLEAYVLFSYLSLVTLPLRWCLLCDVAGRDGVVVPQPGSRTRDDYLDGYAPVQSRWAANTGTQSYITDKALVAIRKARKRSSTKIGIVELNPEREKEMRIKVRRGGIPGAGWQNSAVSG